MTIKSGLGHSQQRREFIPMITVSGAEPHNNPRPGLTYARTPHTHTHSCAHTHTWTCAQMGCCKFHNTIQCCMLNTYPTLDRFIDFSCFLLYLHVLLFCSFTCNACKNVCVCVCVCLCVCVWVQGRYKSQLWRHRNDTVQQMMGIIPSTCCFCTHSVPSMFSLKGQQECVCVCVCEGEMDEGGGGGPITYKHTHFHAHTHTLHLSQTACQTRRK